MVPNRAGRWELPPVEWVTFDPIRGSYETVATEAHQLVATAPPPAPPARATPPPATSPAARWSRYRLPVLVGGAAALALLLAVPLVRRLRRRDAAARRRLLAQLGPLRQAPGPARQAATAAEEAWREFLGRRFAVPAEAPPNQWPRLLAARGLEPQVTSELLRLIDDLHYLRYAPQLASTDSLQRELWDRSRRLARRLA